MVLRDRSHTPHEQREVMIILTLGVIATAVAAYEMPGAPWVAHLVSVLTNLIWIWRT